MTAKLRGARRARSKTTVEPQQDPKLISTMELAERLGIRYANLHNLVRRGHLKAPKLVIGATWLWTEAEAEATRRLVKARAEEQWKALRARSRKILGNKIDLDDPKYRKAKQ